MPLGGGATAHPARFDEDPGHAPDALDEQRQAESQGAGVWDQDDQGNDQHQQESVEGVAGPDAQSSRAILGHDGRVQGQGDEEQPAKVADTPATTASKRSSTASLSCRRSEDADATAGSSSRHDFGGEEEGAG